MSKGLEALECSLKLYKMVESAGNDNGFSLNEAWEYHETIKQALLELKAIKDANPSEALKRVSSEIIDGYPTGNILVGMTWEEHSAIKQALLELKQIKGAEPIEALKCVGVLKEEDCITTLVQGKALETIRQYILKAQEQEKVLKVILKKRIDLESFYSTFVKDNLDYKYYEKYYGTYGLELLTQQEFDLLKKVILCQKD